MEFPDLGEHCSETSCNRLDFLPLKCDACKEIFCTDHISYIAHSCPSSYKKDVQVPVCPLCNALVPSKRNDPPDLAVSHHIDNDCKADANSRKKIFVNKCSSKGCKNKEVIPVTCSECGLNFCLKHRHPPDHDCGGKASAIRQKRLNALSKIENNNQARSLNAYGSVQGTISEDEALARAIQASLQESENQPSQSTHNSWAAAKEKCQLS